MMSGCGPLNVEIVPLRSSLLPSTSDTFGPQQPIGLRPDLVRGPVIDSQRGRTPPNIDAERLPGERLLKDPLAQVAGEEEAVRASRPESRQKSQLRNADILRLIHDGEFKRRMRDSL